MLGKVLLLLLCVSSALALNVDFKAGSNISASVTKNGWQYRKSAMWAWSAGGGLFNGVSFLSVSAQKNGRSKELDILAGAIYVNVGMHPFAFLAYFDSELQWKVNTSGNAVAVDTDYEASKGYIGVSFLHIEERNANGDLVAFQSLSENPFITTPLGGLAWGVSNHSLAGEQLKYFTLTAPPAISSSCRISLTFVVTDVAGVIAETNSVVVPKSLESFVEIKDWPYAAPTNYLTLVMGVGTGSASLSASGQSIVTGAVSDDNSAYFTMAKTAIVSGTERAVSISVKSNSTAEISSENQFFYGQLTSVYGGSASYHIASVSFPAGADHVIYDPAQGSGEPVEGVTPAEDMGSFAAKTTVSLVLVLAVLAGLFL